MEFRFLAAMRRIGTAGLDMLLPPGCMSCDVPVSGSFQLCAACFGRCHFITRPYCVICGVPFAYEGQRGAGGKCPTCTARTPHYAMARAALTYDRASRPLLLQFKHADRTELARLFAPLMLLPGAEMLRRADAMVPVPLHRARLQQRGYNQAVLLARALSKRVMVPVVVDGLQRMRRTDPLGGHDAASRAMTLSGAVSVRPARAALLRGKRLVLIDDVMTSGATVDACARALMDNGATRVDVLVAARVPDPDLNRFVPPDTTAMA